VAACQSYSADDVFRAVREIFEAMGAKRLFQSGEKVLLKPNFLQPSEDEKAITTHSQVLLVLCQCFLDWGCRVAIGDGPGIGSVPECIARQRLADPLKRLGVSVVNFTRTVTVALPQGRVVKSVPVAAELNQFDAVISVAKLKTHSQFYFTGSVKNLFGCLPGLLKSDYHLRFANSERLADFFLDILDAVRPRLGFIDGVVGMEGEGPSAGRTKFAGFLAASTDCPALDIEVMKMISLDPSQTIYLRERMKKRGYQVIYLGRPKRVFFQPPRRLTSVESVIPLPPLLRQILKSLTVPIPIFSLPPICRLCGNCIKACPAKPKAITIRKKRVSFIKSRCIRCYCCQEVCPYKAIHLSRPPLMRVWRKPLKVPDLKRLLKIFGIRSTFFLYFFLIVILTLVVYN